MLKFVDEKIVEITKGKVGYYWEEGSYPTFEIFMSDYGNIAKTVEYLNKRYKSEYYNFDYEIISEKWCRILFVFDLNFIYQQTFLEIIASMSLMGKPYFNE